jgi:hypothetical protein
VAQDHLLDAVDVRQDISVPKANDTPAALLEPRRTPFIVGIVHVLPAVGFDDQTAFETDKIDNETELCTCQRREWSDPRLGLGFSTRRLA